MCLRVCTYAADGGFPLWDEDEALSPDILADAESAFLADEPILIASDLKMWKPGVKYPGLHQRTAAASFQPRAPIAERSEDTSASVLAVREHPTSATSASLAEPPLPPPLAPSFYSRRLPTPRRTAMYSQPPDARTDRIEKAPSPPPEKELEEYREYAELVRAMSTPPPPPPASVREELPYDLHRSHERYSQPVASGAPSSLRLQAESVDEEVSYQLHRANERYSQPLVSGAPSSLPLQPESVDDVVPYQFVGADERYSQMPSALYKRSSLMRGFRKKRSADVSYSGRVALGAPPSLPPQHKSGVSDAVYQLGDADEIMLSYSATTSLPLQPENVITGAVSDELHRAAAESPVRGELLDVMYDGASFPHQEDLEAALSQPESDGKGQPQLPPGQRGPVADAVAAADSQAAAAGSSVRELLSRPMEVERGRRSRRNILPAEYSLPPETLMTCDDSSRPRRPTLQLVPTAAVDTAASQQPAGDLEVPPRAVRGWGSLGSDGGSTLRNLSFGGPLNLSRRKHDDFPTGAASPRPPAPSRPETDMELVYQATGRASPPSAIPRGFDRLSVVHRDTEVCGRASSDSAVFGQSALEAEVSEMTLTPMSLKYTPTLPAVNLDSDVEKLKAAACMLSSGDVSDALPAVETSSLVTCMYYTVHFPVTLRATS